MDIDSCFSSVGEFGRYQIAIYFVILFPLCLFPCIILNNVLIGELPSKLHQFNALALNDSSIITEWHIVDDKWIADLIQSLFFFGFLFGVVAFGQGSDKFGRQRMMFAGYHIIFVLNILTIFSTSWKMFAALRFLLGFTVGGAGLVQFVFLQEIVGKSWWAFTNGLQMSLFAVGIAIMVLIAYFIPPWRGQTLATTLPLLVCVVGIWFIPESPRWLYSTGRVKRARIVMEKFARKNGVPHPAVNLMEKSEGKAKVNERSSLIDVLKHPAARYTFLPIAFLWFAICMIYYAMTLAAGSIGENVYASVLFSGIIELPSTFVATAFLNRTWCGRRGCLLVSLLLSAVACAVLTSFPLATGSGGESGGGTWKLATGVCGKFTISAAFTTIYIYTPELFPAFVRNAAVGACSMCGRVGGILAPLAHSQIEVNPSASYWMFAATSLTAAALLYFLPETVDANLPESFDDMTSRRHKLSPRKQRTDQVALLSSEMKDEAV